MAVSLYSDFKLNDPTLQLAYVETLAQVTDAWNAASGGGLVMEAPVAKTGHYERGAFFQAVAAGAVSRRDITSTAAATSIKLTQAEIDRVKLNRKVGPLDMTLDSLRKIGSSVEEISYNIGAQVATGQAVEAVNSVLAALVGGIQNVGAAVTYDYSGTGTISHSVLATGNALFGDRSVDIAAYVMHSKVYWDLIKQAINDKVYEVAGMVIIGGSVPTFNRPVLVIDSPSLVVPGTPYKYLTVGIARGAASLQMTEGMQMMNLPILGNEQILQRFQGEYAYNIGLKGYSYNIGAGGVNPSAAAVATGTNWTQVASDIKQTAGIVVKTQ